MAKRVSPYAKVARLKDLARYFVMKFEPVCPFCNEVITVNDLMQGHEPDKLTIHHCDEDRSNNIIENLILTHRSCHRRHHKLKERAEKKVKGKRKPRKPTALPACSECGEQMAYAEEVGGWLTCTNWSCKNYFAV